jgi:hypothetical protein
MQETARPAFPLRVTIRGRRRESGAPYKMLTSSIGKQVNAATKVARTTANPSDPPVYAALLVPLRSTPIRTFAIDARPIPQDSQEETT